MKTSVLTRRQLAILRRMADGIVLRRFDAFPAPARHQLGADFVDTIDVQKLVERRYITAQLSGHLNAAQYALTDAGRAMLEEEGRR